jgi:hypothetical protein
MDGVAYQMTGHSQNTIPTRAINWPLGLIVGNRSVGLALEVLLWRLRAHHV